MVVQYLDDILCIGKDKHHIHAVTESAMQGGFPHWGEKHPQPGNGGDVDGQNGERADR